MAAVEPVDTFDVLRIIAKDARGLPSADRETIRTAADELEICRQMIIGLQTALIESNQRRIATNDQLIESRAREVQHPFKASMNGAAKFLLEYRNASGVK